ncbi:MAG: Na+/H+ antiporter subunit E [Rickettsiaceae bacterium]|nr:Na+/H+ antiporter subunit E [Rickettsiaceae bacterium]MDP4832180.1 Na+/H+ antiporter subunit E [Rickettsiaceae bacterium]MDP5020377.1 Na+/H+ antiporter subunit E [Rickettsiaceae bacterium]MDP5083346.1 Na+/H+ antiporter subunit E [Rickettsiaceae bacterium]
MLIKIISLIAFISIWIGLTGVHTEVQLVIFAFAAPLLTLILAWRLKLLPAKNVYKISAIFYVIWLLKEIFMSSIAVVKIACRKNLGIQPMLEPVKSIQNTDIGLVTYANSITLTPGTVTLSTEGNNLLVHALDLQFMNDLQEGEMDNRVKKIIK